MKKILISAVALTGLSLLVWASENMAPVVVQKDKAFSTGEITIKTGDTITFTNADDVAHNVFSVSKENPFMVSIQQPGEATKVQFTNAGVTEVRCAIHPKMKLIVNVHN